MTTVFIMLDGVRPDAIAATRSPNLKALIARGASTLRAQSVMPSVTLPCHTSIFHSVPPSRHGITSNVWTPLARPLPGLMELAKQQLNLRCAFFINWEELRDVSRPGSLSHLWYTDASYVEHGDDLVANEAVRVMPTENFDFTFIYFGTVDTFGHLFGWMSPEYLAQLERVDTQLGRVLSMLPADAHVIVQADHGGHERNHGTNSPEDITIPWVAAGPTVRAGHTIQSDVSLLDTAPTLARMLGLKASSQWEGHCVDETFLD